MRKFDNAPIVTPPPAIAPDANTTWNSETAIRNNDSASKFYQPNYLEEYIPEELLEMA